GLPGWSAGADLSFPPGVLVSGPGRCVLLRGAPPRPDGAMIILGINAYHGDVAAALLRDGELVAAVEEERFRRIKHWAGFPREAIQSCLAIAGAEAGEIDAFAVSRDPNAHLWRKGLFALRHRPNVRLIRDRAANVMSVRHLARACAA